MTFEILWYSGGPAYAPNRCIGRTRVERQNLDSAIIAACNALKNQRTDETRLARGFYVRPLRGDLQEAVS